MSQETVELCAESLLIAASSAARYAARACRIWELGGDPEEVGESAVAALSAAENALSAVCAEDGLPPLPAYPETRRGRLALASWLLLLAGTDEHGESTDLRFAAAVFDRAAKS